MQPAAKPASRRVPDFISMINSGAMCKAVCVAAELRIADHLAGGPKRADELAQATRSHAPSLHRLMRALASLDLCNEREDGTFELGGMGELLRSDVPNSLRNWTLWYAGYMAPVWENLRYSVQSGESARKLLTGANDFRHLEDDPEAAAVFNGAMAEVTSLVASEVVRAYDFSWMRQIVDVGGGYGALIAAVLRAHPNARGVLFDRPHAVPGAMALLAAAGVAGRCEFVTGSFFDQVPAGADAYLLKAIVHDWDDEQSVTILRNCRRAMAPNGKLLIVERILPERFEANSLHHAIARADLTMLIALGGRERSEKEFATLFNASGFDLVGVTETGLEFSILEGVPC
jgi:orsellinic acid C2-O-methyltransferase